MIGAEQKVVEARDLKGAVSTAQPKLGTHISDFEGRKMQLPSPSIHHSKARKVDGVVPGRPLVGGSTHYKAPWGVPRAFCKLADQSSTPSSQ